MVAEDRPLPQRQHVCAGHAVECSCENTLRQVPSTPAAACQTLIPLPRRSSIKTVTLNGGKAAGRVALVDDRDYELVGQHKWHLMPGKRPDTVYAARSLERSGRKTSQKMNTLITGWPLTDHIDGDGLNNQRSNLRPATDAQNSRNRKPPGGEGWQPKGVTARGARWAAQILGEGQKVHLGVYGTEIEAALAYDAAARHYFGEFARLNFHDGPPARPLATHPRLCTICGNFIDPVDFCVECSDLGRECSVHLRPRRRVDAATCGTKKCKNAFRSLAAEAHEEDIDA